MILESFLQNIVKLLPKYIIKSSIIKNEMVIYVAPKNIFNVILFLRDHLNCQFKSISDICGIDFPERKNRFEVVYNLLSVRFNSRIRVKTTVNEFIPVPSISPVLKGASWYEREVWDMFGIFFIGHSDLRRILTDYGFDGFPLRKDFPLSGYTEVRYDDSQKRVVCEPLELAQEFRFFNFTSPWEQTK